MVSLFSYHGTHSISYHRVGNAGGIPAFYFHGLPGSGLESQLLEVACDKYGVDLIAPDRFGYGQSSPDMSADRYRAWVDVVRQLADSLGFKQFHIVAASGGAPYGLACASLLHERVLSTRIVCGLGSLHIPSLRTGMELFPRSALFLAEKAPLVLRYVYGLPISLVSRHLRHFAIFMLGLLNGQPDRTALAIPPVREIMAGNVRRSFMQGSRGAVADLQAALQPWPFDLAVIHDLQCWHGDKDTIVPLQHSHWLTQQVPGSVLHIVPREGHFSLPILHADTVIASLV